MKLGMYIYAYLYKAGVSMSHAIQRQHPARTCTHECAVRHPACLIICILGICEDSPYLIHAHFKASCLRIEREKETARCTLFTSSLRVMRKYWSSILLFWLRFLEKADYNFIENCTKNKKEYLQKE